MGMPKSIYDTRRDNLRRLSQEWVGWPVWAWVLVALGVAQVVLQVV